MHRITQKFGRLHKLRYIVSFRVTDVGEANEPGYQGLALPVISPVIGLGYFGIGQDVIRNRTIVKMGTIGKTLVFVLFTSGRLNSVVTILTAGAGAVDLVTTTLFAEY